MCMFLLCDATATSQTYTLSLHDALPISEAIRPVPSTVWSSESRGIALRNSHQLRAPGNPKKYPIPVDMRISQVIRMSTDRKSTRLNSSHLGISYAVFCLKKKETTTR